MTDNIPNGPISDGAISREDLGQLALATDTARTPEQLAAAEYAERILCRRRLLPFIQRFNKSYEAGWVHKDICTRLEKFSDDIIAKKSPRLMVWMPPRSGKSEIVSRNFPAWHAGRVPEHEFIVTSYSSSLAMKFSRSVRSLLREPGYDELFPGTKLDNDSQSVEFWQTTAGGAYMAAGVSGPLTGNGMNCVHFQVKVPSKRGILPITDIKVGDEVVGYDHERNEYCWTPVLAVSTQYKTAFVSVNGVICTPEHRVWTDEAGYVPASEVCDSRIRMLSLPENVSSGAERARSECPPVREPDQGVLFSSVLDANSSPDEVSLRLRAEEGRARSDMQSVLLGGEDRYSDMPAVLGPHPEGSVGAPTECYPDGGHPSRVLQSDVLRRLSAAEPETSGSCTSLSGMPLRYSEASEGVHSEEILFTGMLQRAEVIDLGIFGGVEHATAGSCETRPVEMRPLREGRQAECGSPYRPQCGEPSVVESNSALRSLPQPLSSSEHGTCAGDLARILPVGSGHRVVDIQTGTSNFFAGDTPILLHNCGIIDDPTKNREEAESENIRQGIKEWYTSTFYTRLAPGAGILVIMTRWHHDDLAGWLLEEAKNGGDQWEVVSYPAIAEHDEKYRRQGEALHPERYDLAALERIQRAVGPRDWQALYQQQPTATDGAYFKKEWFRYYLPQELPSLDDMTLYTAWDFAIGTKDGNDYTVGITVGVDRHHNIYVLDIARGRWDALQICDTILDTWILFRAQRVGMERGQISMALGPLLEKRIAERNLYEFPYDPDGLKTGKADKAMRATPIQGRTRQGKVLFPRHASWIASFEAELLSFPSGVHDDQVDAFAWVGQMMGLYSPPTAPKPKAPSWVDKLNQLQRLSRKSGGSTALGA